VQHLVALSRHIGAEHARLPGGRHDKPHQHRDGGGLAGAIAAEQRRNGPASQVEAYAINGGDIAVNLAQLPHGHGGGEAQLLGDIGFCIGRGSLEVR
jgi:hypothetical protein